MEIINVELIKDKEQGWCYVVHVKLVTSTPITYIILKPVFDRRKNKTFGENVDITKTDNWKKLFEFSFSQQSICNDLAQGRREFIHSLSSFIIRQIGDGAYMEKVPTDSKEPIISECFFDLNNKGLMI